MKKIITLFLSLLIAVVFSGCPKGDDDSDQSQYYETKVIDSALIGDDWIKINRYLRSSSWNLYDYNIGGSDSEYYRFTKTTFQKCSYSTYIIDFIFVPDETINAYCKNGNVYSFADDTVLFGYETNAMPTYLESDYLAAADAGIQGWLANMWILEQYANNGKIIKIITTDNEELFFLALSALD
jgi:hypothetical protein